MDAVTKRQLGIVWVVAIASAAIGIALGFHLTANGYEDAGLLLSMVLGAPWGLAIGWTFLEWRDSR